MIIHNPTNSSVSITVAGVNYVVAAESDVQVPAEVGKTWLKTHQFLSGGEGSVVTAPAEDKPEPAPVEEAAEVSGEVQEKPKARRGSTKR